MNRKSHARFGRCGRINRFRLPGAASHALTQPTAKLTVDLGSPPEREQLVAQISYDREQWAEIHQHLGGSQGDIGDLKVEDVIWEQRTVSFRRKKTGVPVIVHLGTEALNILKDLPSEGSLFPYLSRVRAGDRATEFPSRCWLLKIHGVTLRSYRYGLNVQNPLECRNGLRWRTRATTVKRFTGHTRNGR